MKCKSITSRGRRCSRNVYQESDYCRQHHHMHQTQCHHQQGGDSTPIDDLKSIINGFINLMSQIEWKIDRSYSIPNCDITCDIGLT